MTKIICYSTPVIAACCGILAGVLLGEGDVPKAIWAFALSVFAMMQHFWAKRLLRG